MLKNPGLIARASLLNIEQIINRRVYTWLSCTQSVLSRLRLLRSNFISFFFQIFFWVQVLKKCFFHIIIAIPLKLCQRIWLIL
ncbi:MAG: hypothetical protein EBZ45_02230 [Actinobacteria bacterium]|nr:hypothetical protein [Actinomycetota bacterium]